MRSHHGSNNWREVRTPSPAFDALNQVVLVPCYSSSKYIHDSSHNESLGTLPTIFSLIFGSFLITEYLSLGYFLRLYNMLSLNLAPINLFLSVYIHLFLCLDLSRPPSVYFTSSLYLYLAPCLSLSLSHSIFTRSPLTLHHHFLCYVQFLIPISRKAGKKEGRLTSEWCFISLSRW